jgi:glycosyltransferase involved in cell wall biosynthesis
MRIVQIAPSAGDSFYCENCLRDATLVKAMIKLGHDVLMVPLYLPVQIEEDASAHVSPIFFGGLNVYLQQKSALFRKTPRWLDQLLDSPKLLSWIGRKAGMTSARNLGETTTSMLRGEQGQQIKELNRLVDWLGTQENKPDIICLSNILLVGLAGPIRKRLGVPVVCLLQDEDGFLDGLSSPYREQAWQVIAERSTDVDAFVAVSEYYAEAMRERLGFDPDRVHVVYTGISLQGYESPRAAPEIPTIGYLSRMCPDRGLDTLVDAFIKLKNREGLVNARLRITGGRRADDKAFIERIERQLSSHGLLDDVDFLPDFAGGARCDFLQTLSVLSVPEKQPMAYGLYVLEALAAGVPVVQPARGVFPELLEITGGGVLCEPNDADDLADALESLLFDPQRAGELGRRGREAIFEKFDIDQTAGEMVRTYGEIAQKFA